MLFCNPNLDELKKLHVCRAQLCWGAWLSPSYPWWQGLKKVQQLLQVQVSIHVHCVKIPKHYNLIGCQKMPKVVSLHGWLLIIALNRCTGHHLSDRQNERTLKWNAFRASLWGLRRRSQLFWTDSGSLFHPNTCGIRYGDHQWKYLFMYAFPHQQKYIMI